MELENKIKTNMENRSLLDFFNSIDIEPNGLIPKSEKSYFTHEGLEDFLNMDVPEEIKFLWGSTGIFVNPKSGEIIAFQFYRSDYALKIVNPNQYRGHYIHIRNGLLRNLKIKNAFKVNLRYFSNIWGDENTIIDLRFLNKNWAYGLYLLDESEKEINRYYSLSKNK